MYNENQTEKKGISQYDKLISNPFLANDRHLLIPIRSRKESFSGDGDLVVVSRDTGELTGSTAFIKTKKVDAEQFLKVFQTGMKSFFDLSRPASKVLCYISEILKKDQDRIIFDKDKCKETQGIKSDKTIFSGLAELCDKQFIARSKAPNIYYINHTIFFNGNRLTLVNDYIKEIKKQTKKLDPNQEAIPFAEIESTKELAENNE